MVTNLRPDLGRQCRSTAQSEFEYGCFSGGKTIAPNRAQNERCMPLVNNCALLNDALLRRHTASGAYTDCYTTTIPRSVLFADFVTTFYTTRLFKLERLILRWAIAKPTTDSQAYELATGQRQDFAAWTVKDRSENQLLMCDLYGRTRSWLMTTSDEDGTVLYFGSAVLRARRPAAPPPAMGVRFSALLGFHRLYSRLLLGAARRSLLAHL